MKQVALIELAKLLKIKPAQAVYCLSLPLGKQVNQGDLIAQKKTLLGRKKVLAPVDGWLYKLEADTGQLILTDSLEVKDENQLGKKLNQGVVEVKTKKDNKESESATKTKSSSIKTIFGWGQARGKLVHFKAKLGLKDLKPEWENKIVWAEGLSDPGVVFKADVLDLAGLIIKTNDDVASDWQDRSEASEIAVLFIDDKTSLTKLVGKKIKLDGQAGTIDEV